MKHIKKRQLIQKQLKKKIQRQEFKKTKLTPAPPKLSPVIKNKRSMYFKHREFTYRLPVMLTFVGLLMLILVVPSLIVMPNGGSSGKPETADEYTQDTDSPEAINVSVMRTKADVVEDVPLEHYIVGVVASEMPADFEMEALKAQALAARTYAVTRLLGGNEDESYDITDTVQHQVYRSSEELQQQWGSNYDANMEKIRAAVEATKGEILTYDNAPITPAYFSMSNGYTENSEDYWENELPYLRSVPSPWDLENPKLVDQETYTLEELEERLEIELSKEASTDMILSRTDSGRVSEFIIANHTFTGRDIRDRLELRSSDFSVEQTNDHFIFTTKGYGHGIGMSQYGADAMAKEGKNYQEILKHYYQDVEITTLDEAAPALVSR